VLHAMGAAVPAPVAMLGLGVGLLGAAFMLAWAADAGEAVFSGGLIVGVIALVTVLPEFIIEIRFAYIQAAELVTANLTGATRLLLVGATTLPLAVALLAPSAGRVAAPLRLAESRRLELGILLITSTFAIQVAVRGNLSIFDSSALLGLYFIFARRVQGTTGERPAVVGVGAGLLTLPRRYQRGAIVALIVLAGTVVVMIANPFADALIATGASAGIDPYLLIQSVVPVATESPEFVVVAVLVANRRPAQGLALFLAAAVSQWTLGLGVLPLAYLAGGGGVAMPLAPREQLELAFTIAMTLFVVAALSTLEPARFDAILIAGVFAASLLYPTALVRIGATFVLLVYALDLLWDRRRFIRPILNSAWVRRSPEHP
jgi:cation:H+ antiporter